MKTNRSIIKVLVGLCFGIASLTVYAQSMKVTLAGSQEVPPVTTSASGTGSIMVSPDGLVSGSVITVGVDGTMAHIHEAPMGQNGPVIVPFAKTADGVWSVPAGAKLSDAQLQSLKSGSLYINVHSAANKGGEIRGQLKP
ncbi:MAG: CHRD domain-containing protein [Polynucleobacter sp.]